MSQMMVCEAYVILSNTYLQVSRHTLKLRDLKAIADRWRNPLCCWLYSLRDDWRDGI